MKYIVECKKVVHCKFVVDADSVDQVDRKLSAGQYEFKTETMKTQDVYQGYEYVGHIVLSGEGDETVICSIEDLCDALGTAMDDIECYMYENTDCGMPISWDDHGVTLVGYVEGADCDGPSETLAFPFTLKDFNDTVDALEAEADVMWHEWNDEDTEENYDENEDT